MILKRFGKEPRNNKERFENAPNYHDGKFLNVEPTDVNPHNVPFFKILWKFIKRPKSVTPPSEPPHVKSDLKQLKGDKPEIVWFGHSSYLMKYSGFTILVDPVFSGNASPFTFFGNSFQGSDNYYTEDFPHIDLLLLTHDHYDHLDYNFLKEIKGKVKRVVTPLGVGAHLKLWGYEEELITELNWEDHIFPADNLKIIAKPSRHFSGRSFARFKTLWSSFILEWGDYRIYIGGDSGYSSTFERIGKEYGKFDLVFLECGQYNTYWPEIHMFPEETVQAARDLNAEVLIPVHWSKFVLSTHPWNEPVKRAMKEAERTRQKIVSPRIGEVYTLGEPYEQKEWWNFKN